MTAFVTVAQQAGFRAAARTLEQSPSALSHAVASLEKRLGVQLFHRTTRHVSLTEAGRAFYTRIAPALGEIDLAVEALSDFRERPIGRLRINADTAAAEQCLAPVVLDFLHRYPEMEVEIVCEGRLIDIAAEGFDCGIRLAELVPQDMVAIPVGPEQRHIVVGAPDYLESAPPLTSPADLQRHRCIQLRLPGGAIYRWEFVRRGKEIKVETHGNLVVGSSRLALIAARQGHGLAYVSCWAAQNWLSTGQLEQWLDAWTPAYPGLCLYYPRHRHLGAGMRAFIDFARECGTKLRP
nr:LysR family transcriptional regulator [Salinicola halimionae]